MKKLLVLSLLILGCGLASSSAVAQTRRVDEFANRRQHERWVEQVRKEQDRSKQRVIQAVPLPMPYGYPSNYYGGYNGGLGGGDLGGGGLGGNGNYEYVVVPAGYRVINGQMQFVPAHYVLVPRYRW